MSARFTYGLLVSGNLGYTCLKAVYEWFTPVFVLTDRNSHAISTFCKEKNIPIFQGNPRQGKGFSFIAGFKVDVLLSVNYLFLIEKDMLSIPTKYAINFHGSLLPKYRGRTPHVWAIINGEDVTGITAHFMTEGCDEGDIIATELLPITQQDTGADILKKYLKHCPLLIKMVVDKIENSTLQAVPQNENEATYFGKRTPEDGEIMWLWDKSRIRNWIRAQARPYPGAFTYYEGKKIIIHRCDFDKIGFHYQDENGLILKGGNHPVVKTVNGSIRLSDIESESPIYFEKGKVFHERN